jgi:hypothetical protein
VSAVQAMVKTFRGDKSRIGVVPGL